MDSKIIMRGNHPFIAHQQPTISPESSKQRSTDFFNSMNSRRSVREFSNQPVPKEVIENIIKTASTAPSGAHKQPWTFCVVSDPLVKQKIREAAEVEEKESYENRMSEEWLQDLAPLQTDWNKPFLEVAPYLIVVFKRAYELTSQASKKNNYYVNEWVGIACGFLLSAIHHAGLVALTHTPSPMNFLTKILNRPENERPFLLIPVGYPAKDALVPDLKRKTLDEVTVWF